MLRNLYSVPLFFFFLPCSIIFLPTVPPGPCIIGWGWGERTPGCEKRIRGAATLTAPLSVVNGVLQVILLRVTWASPSSAPRLKSVLISCPCSKLFSRNLLSWNRCFVIIWLGLGFSRGMCEHPAVRGVSAQEINAFFSFLSPRLKFFLQFG